MMKKFLLSIVCVLLIIISFAQAPADYYDTATGTGYTLKTQLYNIIKDHTIISYSGLYNAYKTTDNIVIGSENKVFDMYSIRADGTADYYYSHTDADQCGTYSVEGDCYNREHSMPQSWFNEASPMVSDLYHVYPTDGKVNGMRSNYPFGEVGTPSSTSTNGSKVGTCSYPGYSGTVFEPIDEFKGDFARTYFYMATRYETLIDGWSANSTTADAILNETEDQVFEDWYLNMIIEWHNADPVSQKEIDRNDAVYAIQNNRNPFIDHPEYVAQIWGGDGVFISSVNYSPTSPTSSENVTVTATITSSSGSITTANLKWGATTGNYPNIVAMTSSKGSYSADIPAQTNGSSIYFIIEAEDDNAQSSSSSEYNYTVEDNPSTAIFEEDFETATVNTPISINGWSRYDEVGTNTWAGIVYNSNIYAQMTAYASGQTSNISWLITPEINLTNITEATFSFISKDGYNNGDPVEVFISTDYTGTGDPNTANWTNLNPTLATGSTSGYAASFTESGDIDLTSYCGNTIYIAYKYTGGDPSLTTTMQIDDVLITGQESTSGIPQITGITNSPESPTDEDDVTISATITDSDGTISTAEIKWGTESGSYPNSVTMTNSVNVYSGDIPAQIDETTVYYVIEATDNDAATNRSEENSYTVGLNQLPQITNVFNSPAAPAEGEDVTISATITDSDGSISSSEIKWGTAKGSFDNTVTMTYSGSDNIYIGTIESQTEGTIVSYVIEATDNDSESNRSDEFSFTFNQAVNQAPVISNVLLNPASPTENDNVSISASATDSDGSVETVILKWKRGTAAFTEVGMNLSGGKYYGLIPKQTIGETIYFSIVAEDNEGLQGTYNDEYEVSESNGIDIVENNFQIFPNPASLFVTIKIENYHGEIEIKMYDILGAQVLIKKIDFSSQYNLSLEDLDSGIYFINLDADNVLVTKRIIIKK